MSVVVAPCVPFTNFLPCQLFPGKKIIVRGVPKCSALEFNFVLLCGPSIDYSEIALTVDAIFDGPPCGGGGCGRSSLVVAHRARCGWSEDQVLSCYFPFTRNVPFELVIMVECGGFKIIINNQLYSTYRHQFPLHLVSHYAVLGDVVINEIVFI